MKNSNVKRQRRSFKDMLHAEFAHCGCKKSFRDVSHPNRMRIVVPLAYDVLASVLDKDECNDKGRSYLFKNAEEISIAIGFSLASITRIASKWMNYDIKIHFDKSTPPSPEIKEEHCSEINEKMEVFQTIDKSNMNELNQTMLLECTNKACSSFRETIIKTCNIKTADFPSFHMATKH